MTRVLALALFAACCLAAVATAQSFSKNGDFMSMSRTRRTPQGVVRMRGYVGLSRRGGAAFAGGYAGARTEDFPAYAEPGASAEQDPEAPEQDEEEEPEVRQEDEDPAPEPAPYKPPKPSRARPSKPAGRPPRPSRPSAEDDEDDFAPPPNFGANGKGRGGATAIATSYSNGKGATSNSHAIAYDGTFSGGQFKHRY